MEELQGFRRARKAPAKKRLIVAVEGKEKSGKTTFGLSAPGPIVYFDSDLGKEGVLEKFVEEKEIWEYEIKTAKEIMIDAETGPQIDAEKEFQRFKRAYYQVLGENRVRTIVLDTATEVWELLRLAFFGRLAQVPPMKYGPANEEYRRLIRAAYSSNKNLILLHRVTDEYVGTIDAKGREHSVRTGKKLRAGFKDTGYLVQVNLVTYYSPEEREFGIQVRDCRQNMGIAGERFQGEIEGVGSLCSFPFLATAIFPDTELDDWR